MKKSGGLLCERKRIRFQFIREQKKPTFARYPKRHKITTDSAHNHSIVPNLLAREFTVTQREEVWTTDITYVWTYEGWMYLAVVMDLYSRQIIGWAMAAHMKTALCVQALQMAYWRRKPPKGLLHHSDRGSQYTRHQYRAHLQVMGVQASMSGKGQGWHNAPTERFFRSLKYEYLNYEILKTRNDAKLGGLDYLAYYNSRRPHSLLAYFSPMEFELIPVVNLS
ncbi:IS3 family transposase [Candidatus Regiella endosymbiont of Tuberolachnus salignus]|uniref:IS3 family transposase n=1 Tax=Candidatus Regiella endosymbiont of Tuberolachnus salignus TaxID=3077956 RepID=UPI0030D06F73